MGPAADCDMEFAMTKKFATLAMTTMLIGASAPSPGAGTATEAAPQLLVIDPFDLPIVSADRVDGRLIANFSVQLRDAGAMDRARDDLPQIRARLLSAAMDFNHLHGSALTPPDAELLSKSLNRTETLDMPEVVRVLIVELRSSPI